MVQPTEKCVLPGLYGKETMEECILKNPKLRDGRGRKAGERERGTLLRGEAVVREGEGLALDGRAWKGITFESVEDGEGVEPRRRKSSFGQWLSRKRTK